MEASDPTQAAEMAAEAAEAATETVDVAAAVQAEADASWGYAVVVLLATLILGEVFRRCTRSAPPAAAAPAAAPAAKKKPASKSKSEPASKSKPEKAAPAAESKPGSAPESDSESAATAAASNPDSALNQRVADSAAAAGSMAAAAQAPQVATPISPQDLMERLDCVPVFTMVQQDRTARRLVESGPHPWPPWTDRPGAGVLHSHALHPALRNGAVVPPPSPPKA